MKTADRTIDPITFEILSHKLHEITKEMGVTLERVGASTTTTQIKDYEVALYRANGEVLSTSGGGGGMYCILAGFAVKAIIARFGEEGDIFPDDMFLINDPYVATVHTSDIFMVSPVFYEDRLILWSANFVHVMDIGAMSPGGFSPAATEVYHEGVRSSGIKLVERGKLRKDVFDTITNMTRQPVMVGLDLNSQMAANNVAKSRARDMIKKYGAELMEDVSSQMVRYTEEIVRRRIREIPDGSWKEKTYIRNADEKSNFMVTLTKKDDELVFDFTGSDKQAKKGINLALNSTLGICFQEVVPILAYDIPPNQGAFSPISVIAPSGTVVNVQPPGPVSLNTKAGRTAVHFLAASVLVQAVATSEKWKHEVRAGVIRGRMANHAGISQYGRYYVSTYTDAGGIGATSCRDGVNSGKESGEVSNVEWQELSFPMLFLFRRHMIDGGGEGKFRGGSGVESAITLHDAPEGRLRGMALGMGNSGKGLFGGYPGTLSILALIKGTRVQEVIAENKSPVSLADLGGRATLLPYCDFDMENGDVLYICMDSGGGFGDPLGREPQQVLCDLRDGLVSQAAAERVFGVVLDGQSNGLDLAATRKLRARLVRERIKAFEASPAGKREKPLPGTRDMHGKIQPKAGVARPFRESLELYDASGGTVIRCNKCLFELCLAQEDWREACGKRRSPLRKTGYLMETLVGLQSLEELFCPSCGILFDTYLVEEDNDAEK